MKNGIPAIEYSFRMMHVWGMMPSIALLGLILYLGTWELSVGSLIVFVTAAMGGVAHSVAYYLVLAGRIGKDGTVVNTGGVRREIAGAIIAIFLIYLLVSLPHTILIAGAIYGLFYFSLTIVLFGRSQKRIGKRIVVKVDRNEARRREIILAITLALATIIISLFCRGLLP